MIVNDASARDCSSTECALLDDLARGLITYPGRIPDPSRLGPLVDEETP